jgi:hypothetical protein
MATFEKDLAGWNELLRSPKGDVYKHINTLTQRVRRLAMIQVGKKTMALYRSIKANTSIGRSGPVGTVLADNRIALMHHNGTRRHMILPKRQNTLRFPSRGKIVYAAVVNHPGTKPNRFLTDPLRKVIDD